jgi:hypothetical protein
MIRKVFSCKGSGRDCLKEAIIWLGDISIELDYKLVVDNILDISSNRMEFGNIMKMCQSLLSFYPNLEINFIKRQTNCIAYHLTRASKLYASRKMFDFILFCIFAIVMSEMI